MHHIDFDAVQKIFHSNITRGLVLDVIVLIISIVLLLASAFLQKKGIRSCLVCINIIRTIYW